MEDKIWFNLKNNKPYPVLDNVILVTNTNSSKYIKEIKDSIDSFNLEVEWDGMWDLEEASKRFSNNEVLFLLRDSQGALGHVWFDDSYLYNMFVSQRRLVDTSMKFILHCFNFIQSKDIVLYCDSWNFRAQNFFKKVGAIKISSYI